jgi:hypothetical protein
MHLSREGKRQMASQIAIEIRQITEDSVNSIISLDWDRQERENPVHTRLDMSGARVSERPKKPPVTRTNDFLWTD